MDRCLKRALQCKSFKPRSGDKNKDAISMSFFVKGILFYCRYYRTGMTMVYGYGYGIRDTGSKCDCRKGTGTGMGTGKFYF